MGVLCANNTTMNLTTTRQLNLSPNLPLSAQKGHAFNEMDKTLVLIPALCDVGCDVIFKGKTIQVIKNKKIIIEENRDALKNLRLIPLDSSNNKPGDQTKQSDILQLQYTADSVYQQKPVSHLQAFYYALLGAPLVTTLIRAINNNWLTSFPGLTAAGVRKHLPRSI